MRKKEFVITLVFVLNFFSIISLFAQAIPSDIQNELTGYENKIEQFRNENKPAQELEYLNKAAFLCWNNQLYTKAIEHFKRVHELNENSGNRNGILLSANYIGMIYDETENYTAAITYFKKGLEISKGTNDKNNIASSILNIAQTYQQIPNYEESNKWALEGVDLAKEINNIKLVRTFYGILANNYQSLGNSQKSIEYFDLFASIDKFLKKEEIKTIKKQSETEVQKAQQEKQQTEEELVKQTDKLKETETSLAQIEELTREQRMQLELKESKIREQAAQLKLRRIMIRGLIGVVLLLILFFTILFVLYRKIRAQKQQIEEQRDILDLQNKKINSSIQYAQNIQRAILPVKIQLEDFFESFIIYKPKDIVSGDFYWFAQMQDNAFLAVVDCTGHGVPGAFMSMIGNSLLNEIVLEKKITEPAKILSLLNEKVIESLRQKETENNDGMDVCLIAFNLKTKKITFSGAKRPLFIYKSKATQLDEIKGDRLSIGGKKRLQEEVTFKNHVVETKPGDTLYLSSDGLTDQNNVERKRFGSKRLKEIILKNISEPMTKQKDFIENELTNFQQNEEQRDDITLIGIKIN